MAYLNESHIEEADINFFVKKLGYTHINAWEKQLIDRETHSVLIQRQKLEPFKNNWTEVEIKNRQIEIVAFANEYWNPNKIV